MRAFSLALAGIALWVLGGFASSLLQEYSTIDCAAGRTLLTRQVHVRSHYHYRCHNQPLTLIKKGGWVVHSGGTLELDDVAITLDKNEANPIGQGLMVTLRPGATLILRNSSITAAFNVPVAPTETNKGHAKSYLIYALQPQPNRVTTTVITHNRMTATSPQTLGLVVLYDFSQLLTDDFSAAELRDGYMTGMFNDNIVSGFTGAFIGFHLNNFTIRGNQLNHNYGGNIGISGKNITVDANRILYPGNGGDGDGISVVSYLENARITNNDIRYGSCYGMWFRVNQAHQILVENNSVFQGVTGGIHFSASPLLPKGAAEHILISGNRLIENKGFGISIDRGIEGITLRDNFLFNNKPEMDGDIVISNKAQVREGDNYLLAPTTPPQKAKTLRF